MATAKYWNGSSWVSVGYENPPIVKQGTAPTDTSAIWIDTSTDGEAAVLASIGDAKGDLIGFSADNTPVKIDGSGASNGSVLVRDSSATPGVKWDYPDCARMYKTGTQSITENTTTKVTGFTKEFDSTGTSMVDTTNSRIVLPRIGRWRVTGAIAWATSSLNLQSVAGFIFFNGSLSSQRCWTARPYLANATYGICPPMTSIITTSAVTDYIELGAYWYAGVGGSHTVDGIGGGQYVWLEAQWIGPSS